MTVSVLSSRDLPDIRPITTAEYPRMAAVDLLRLDERVDLEVKLPIYAAAGIPEYWVIDLENKEIIQATKPLTKQATYGHIVHHPANAVVKSTSLEGVAVVLEDIDP